MSEASDLPIFGVAVCVRSPPTSRGSYVLIDTFSLYILNDFPFFPSLARSPYQNLLVRWGRESRSM